MQKDIVIIGKGPAGISASLYTTRSGYSTLVIGTDNGALKRADKVANYFGFAEPVSAAHLINEGYKQAQNAGAEIISDEVVDIRQDDSGFHIKTLGEEFSAKAVIIATGADRSVPKLNGLDSFEGRGVSYCAVCDGFFHRNKPVAVLGDGDYALHEAEQLLKITKEIAILTNGKNPTARFHDSLKIYTAKIEAFEGGERLERVKLADEKIIEISGLFVAVGVAGCVGLAKKLGAETGGNNIKVDSKCATTVPGLFAAGDCTGGMLQICKAVYEGAQAAASALNFLNGK